MSSRKISAGLQQTHPFTDTIVSVFHHPQGEISTELVHQHIPQHIQFWESETWVVSMDGKRVLGARPTL